MTSTLDGLPALDAHAHVDPSVTPAQLAGLGHSHTFAVTRSLGEAESVRMGGSRALTWGIGVHPGVPAAQAEYSEREFARLLPRFALVGEIGLDRRGGDLSRQIETLTSVLRVAADEPVLLSLHSSGAGSRLLDVLEQHPHPGAILHWWSEDGAALERAIATGAYFSFNASSKVAMLSRVPRDRVLTETDFPAARGGARKPGDTTKIEAMLGELWGTDVLATRHVIWANLRRLATRAQALDRLPEPLADLLEAV